MRGFLCKVPGGIGAYANTHSALVLARSVDMFYKIPVLQDANFALPAA
uniref:Uncharacterized protein n=1 Tax=Candidatus Kentrum sp. UNK TaxID=2126344 RepID=A0A451B2T0_9GAMM|nr:MAG: hypothetical protein BECKUNK1418G_GA0071005_11313 [Candidatus Kentron sp. UNK]VFK72572.1 MAG: hypothetical protein BECKUNK1418H_GA0071006_11234 [Candidatus Kentron sp. UNK]